MSGWAIGAADIEKAGKAIFEFRAASANDPDPAHRHPMIWRDYKWDNLPVVEKVYYCDMAIKAFTSLGIDCRNAPVFDEQGQLVA